MKVDIPIPEGINVAAIPLDFVRFVEFKPVVKRTQPSVVAVIKKAPAMGGCKACGKYHRYCFTVPNMVLRGGVRLFRNDGKDGDIIPYQREFPAGWLGLAEFGDYRDKGYLVFERVNGNEWKPAINKRPQIFLYIISTTLSSRQKAAGINVKESEGVLAKRSASVSYTHLTLPTTPYV